MAKMSKYILENGKSARELIDSNNKKVSGYAF